MWKELIEWILNKIAKFMKSGTRSGSELDDATDTAFAGYALTEVTHFDELIANQIPLKVLLITFGIVSTLIITLYYRHSLRRKWNTIQVLLAVVWLVVLGCWLVVL